jgi:hypothetical protein
LQQGSCGIAAGAVQCNIVQATMKLRRDCGREGNEGMIRMADYCRHTNSTGRIDGIERVGLVFFFVCSNPFQLPSSVIVAYSSAALLSPPLPAYFRAMISSEVRFTLFIVVATSALNHVSSFTVT